MGTKYLHELIAQGENQHLDFKYEISDAKKIARTLSAFANTSGGKLLIGVRDNGSVAGVKTDEEAYMIESAAHIFCKPRVEYTLKSWIVDGKTVLEVSVEESRTKPHTAPWKDNIRRAFIRVDDENFVANSVQVGVWKKVSGERPVLVRYNQNERELMTFLRQNTGISMNGFCKLSEINYHKAKKILINLVSIGILRINYTEHAVTYSLKDIPEY